MSNKMKIEELRVGQSFRVDGNEYTKLNDLNLCILDTCTGLDCVFDCFDADYDKSLLRYYINNRFCELSNIDKSMLESVYKSDKLTLLPSDAFETYKSFICARHFVFWWLRQAFDSSLANSLAPVAFYDYFVSSCRVNATCGVRPVLIFKKSIEVELI